VDWPELARAILGWDILGWTVVVGTGIFIAVFFQAGHFWTAVFAVEFRFAVDIPERTQAVPGYTHTLYIKVTTLSQESKLVLHLKSLCIILNKD
jgi:hypothetical protein